ncbi:MAG TPA: acetylxylan esterase, partial [Leptospiraceae bacterium]|nr:acetylxylan esterase [Leptospiraceae bacterium]
YFAPALKQPAFFTVGLADDKSSPACAFALFNHLQSDKTMDLYPDEEKDPLGTGQRKKSAEFLSSVFESNAG